jgi:intracellular septation protein
MGLCYRPLCYTYADYCMIRTLLSFVLECLPLVAFFVASFYMSFLEATGLYVALTAIVVFIIKEMSARLPYLSLTFGVFVIGSGILSILFREPAILIIADSVYFFLGAFILLASLNTPTTLTERMFSYAFDLSPHGWRVVTWQWVLVFVAAGISNEVVRVMMTPEWWIGFQFWRALAINFVVLFQLPFYRLYRNTETTNAFGFRHHVEKTGF